MNKKTDKLCDTCNCKAGNLGHLCDPKVNKKVYVCADCGIIATEKGLLCKPKILKLK
ncbi:MAG: hypothetical protein U9O94_08085 [Nanoarchaeota archaeon]|nr:hypothetical protein [Nanoarchaeota archaeon]